MEAGEDDHRDFPLFRMPHNLLSIAFSEFQ